MSEEENNDDFDNEIEHLELIPEELHSFLEEGPFTRCVDCDVELYTEANPYTIHKSVHRKEVVFEFAICMECYETLNRSFSKETSERLMAHFSKFDAADVNLEHCIDCHKPRGGMENYTLAGGCFGPFFEHGYAMCGECQEKILPLISDETRKSKDEWIGQNFPCAPESSDLVPDSPLLF